MNDKIARNTAAFHVACTVLRGTYLGEHGMLLQGTVRSFGFNVGSHNNFDTMRLSTSRTHSTTARFVPVNDTDHSHSQVRSGMGAHAGAARRSVYLATVIHLRLTIA